MSSWPPARVEGGVRAAARGVNSAASAAQAAQVGVFQIVQIHSVFIAKVARVTLRCNVFVDFSIPLSCKTPSFESFFGRLPARNALKTRCFSWEGYQKVKKTSSDSSGGPGRLWRSGSALGGSGGALGGLGRALGGSIYRKTPDQPHSGRYVTI